MKDTSTKLLFAVLFLSAVRVFSGHPPWPLPRHSAEYRQANVVFLRFQDAIAAERWQEALALCSDRLRTRAAQWPSPQVFFRETMPIENLLAQDFGYWTTRSNFYGLLVPLTEPDSKPFIQWFWAISFKNKTWAVDYPPQKLEDYTTAKRTAIQARDDKIKQIRQDLESKLRSLKTHLAPVTEQCVTGSPMLFRVELINSGSAPVHYQDAGVGYHPLIVLKETGEPVPAHEEPSQLMVRHGELAAGSSVVLAEKIDITANHEITKPGKYFVQFNGGGLDLGEPFPSPEPGPFGENEGLWSSNFIPVLTKFPSEIITIEVTDGQQY